jgi:hypothetical protein
MVKDGGYQCNYTLVVFPGEPVQFFHWYILAWDTGTPGKAQQLCGLFSTEIFPEKDAFQFRS